MDAVTVEQITTWSKLDFDGLGYDDPDALQTLVDRATGDVMRWTGRTLADMPSELETAAQEAIQRATEYKAMREQEEVLETVADFDLIQNFSVTGYSETRRSADDAKKAQMIVAWPLLNDLLWGLATDDQKDEWYATWGVTVPAFEVTEVDWSNSALPPGVYDPGA